jgi:hypothetical protein
VGSDQHDPGLLSPRERAVTIAFWDIRGFTKLCGDHKAKPRLIGEFLRTDCETAAKTIYEYDEDPSVQVTIALVFFNSS